MNCSSALMASSKPIVTQTALVKVSRLLNKMSRLESENSLWREGGMGKGWKRPPCTGHVCETIHEQILAMRKLHEGFNPLLDE